MGNVARPGSGNVCSICSHPDKKTIEVELAAYVPVRKLSKRYGMSTRALSEHRSKHMIKGDFTSVKDLKQKSTLPAGRPIVDRMEETLDDLDVLIRMAKKDKNASQLLAAYREKFRALEVVGKAKGEFGDQPLIAINLQASAEWLELRTIIFETVPPEIRHKLAERLAQVENRQPPALPA